MIRQERRKREREAQKDRVFTYTESEYKRAILEELERMRIELLTDAITQLMGSILISLNTEFGFGKKRIGRLIDRFNEQCDCVQKGTVTIHDINKWCQEKGFLQGVYISKNSN